MDSSKLVKEIVSTVTKKFGENGNIKEETTETREKIYNHSFTKEEISAAEVVEAEVEKEEPKKIVADASIEEVAKAIDRKHADEVEANKGTAPVQAKANSVPAPASITSFQAYKDQATKFPWERA